MEEQPAPSGEAPKPAAKGKGMWIAIAVVVVVVVILLAAVLAGLFGPPEEQVLKIGTVLSITGRLSPFGENNRQGVILAVEQINSQGGVLGRSIELFHQNDATDPTTARSAAATLVSQNRVDAIVGATGSGQCKQVIEVAKANGVFEISGSCTSVEFSNDTLTGGWWARTSPSDALQAVVAAYYADTNLSFARAAVMGTNDPYGRGLAQDFATRFTAFGGTITTGSPRIITPTPTDTDYTDDLEAIIEVTPAPEIVYMVGYPADGVQMVEDWEAGKATHSAAWNNIQWLFSEGFLDQTNFIDPLAGGSNNFDVSGIEGTAPSAFGGIYGPGYSSWADVYEARWSERPGLFDDNSYDAAFLVALAAQAGGSSTGAAIKANIRAVANPAGAGAVKIFPGEWSKAVSAIRNGSDIDYEGASGAVNLDALGDPLGGYVIWGVNATERVEFRDVFPEAFVVSLLPPPVFLASAEPSHAWSPEARSRDV